MSSENPSLLARVLRESLEGALPPSLAAVVLFEALAAEPGHELPSELVALHVFLEQRLKPALEKQIGQARAVAVIELVRELVASGLAARKAPQGVPTALTRAEEGPVRVMLIAPHSWLAQGLTGALGPEQVAPYLPTTPEIAARMLESLRPSLILIDGTGAEPEPGSLRVLEDLDRDILVLVWGAGEPAGNAAIDELRELGIDAVALDRQHGPEPLLDYVRSRRAQRG